MITLALAALIVSTAVYWDVRYRRIPNLLTVGGAALAIFLQTAIAGTDGFLSGLAGWGVGFAFLLPGFLFGFSGAGDVKLMAACGAFLGPETAFHAGVMSIIGGSLFALIYIFYLTTRGAGAVPWKRYRGMLQFLLVTGRPTYVPPEPGEIVGRGFPYALAIAAGTLGAICWQQIPISSLP